MTVSIGPRIGVEGVKQFRQAFLEITAEAKRFDTEMKRITADFTANDSAMDRNRKIREQLTKQIEHQKTVVRVASDTYEEAVKAEARAAENYEKAQKKAQETTANLTQEKKKLENAVKKEESAYKSQIIQVEILEKEYEKAKQELRGYTDALGKNHPYVEKLTKELDEQGSELDEEKAKLKEQEKALNAATEAVRKNESEQAKANNRVADASNTLYRASSRVQKYGTDVENAKIKLAEYNEQLKNTKTSLEVWGDRLGTIGGNIVSFGDNLTKYVTAPLAALGGASVKSASDVTDGMAKIYTIATDSQKPMAEMKEELIALSDASGFSMDDLTEAAYQAVSASIDAGEAVEFMGDATRLARAGFTSTTKSVDLLTTIMNAYGQDTYKASYLTDLLLRTQNDGKTIVDEMAESMGIVVPTAAAYGVGIEQVAAAYATMTKQGVNTARATTMLNALFTELEKPDKDAAKLLVDLTGKSFAQLMQDGMNLGEVLAILYDNLDQDSEAFANLFKNIRSGRAANALMAQDSAVLNYELERMSDATGQTDYALKMLETPSLKARKALNKLKNSTIDLGDTIISEFYPVFEKAVEIVDDLRNWIKSLSDEQKKNILRWGMTAAAIGPALKLLGGITSGVGSTIKGIAKLSKAMKGANSVMDVAVNLWGAEEVAIGATGGAILAAVAAYAALGAAAKTSYDQYREGITTAYGLTESERQLIDSKKELYESTMSMNQASREEAQGISENFTVASALRDKYNDLVESTGLATESSQALADMYLNELAQAMGMEREDIEALVDENGRLSASIDDVIRKKRASAMLSAYEDDYAEAIKNRAQAEKDVIQLATQRNKKESDLAKATENLAYWESKANEEAKKGHGISEETQKHLDEAVIAHSAANAAYEETATALEQANEKYQTIMSTIEGFEGTTATLATGSAYEIEAALIKMTEGFVTAEIGTKESLENQARNAKENLDKIKKEFDRGANGITQEMVDAYMKIYTDSEAELTKWEQMNGEKLDGFVDDITQHRGPVAQATKDTMGEIPKETDKAMNESANKADTGLNNILKKVRDMKGSYQGAGADLMGSLVNAFKESQYYDQMYDAGYRFVEGFVNGMKKVDVWTPSQKVMTDAVQASKVTLLVYSPSRVMQEVGEYFTQGFVNGIISENQAVRQASSAMAQSAVDSSWMLGNYTPTGIGYASAGMGNTNTRNISAPISVNVNVNGNVDDVDQLADVIAERINNQIIRRNEVFA